MNRCLSLVLITACLGVSCASTPKSETQKLASNVLRASTQPKTCGVGEVLFCVDDASRIVKGKRNTTCGCAPPARTTVN